MVHEKDYIRYRNCIDFAVVGEKAGKLSRRLTTYHTKESELFPWKIRTHQKRSKKRTLVYKALSHSTIENNLKGKINFEDTENSSSKREPEDFVCEVVAGKKKVGNKCGSEIN